MKCFVVPVCCPKKKPSQKQLSIWLFLFFILIPVVCLAETEGITAREYAVLKKAYAHLQSQKYQACLKTLSPLIKKESPSSFALSYAAQAKGGLEQFEQAVALLIKGTELYPGQLIFWHNLGNYQMQTSDFQGAVETYGTLIEYSKGKPLASYYYQLAFAWYRLGKYSNALEQLEKITRKKNVEQHYLQLQVHCQIALENWPACEKTIKKMIRIEPSKAGYWDLLSRVAINRTHYAQAAAAMEIKDTLLQQTSVDKTIERLYRVQSAWNEVARMQEKENSYTRAESLLLASQYKQALEVLDADGSQDMEHSYLRGRLLFALGRNTEAVNILLQAVQQEHHFLTYSEKQRESFKLEDKRRIKDALKERALLLSGQISWLDRDWLTARDIFKKIELLPGREDLGSGLAGCMQSFLDETRRRQNLPGPYDPPLVMVKPN